MQFATRKRRHPPAIIIVSLIDVLIVVLIFLMVTSTFKQQAPVKIILPESSQAKPGASENHTLLITVPKQGAIYLGEGPVTMEKLQTELTAAAQKDPKISVTIRADTDAPFGQIMKVMDAVKAAHIKSFSASTKGAGQN
jgi:biopolymer transport protein ExbD